MLWSKIHWTRIGKIAESALEGACVLWYWLKSKR